MPCTCEQAASIPVPDDNWPVIWPEKAEELHIFDPNGDVLLKLVRPEDDEETTSSVSCENGEDEEVELEEEEEQTTEVEPNGGADIQDSNGQTEEAGEEDAPSDDSTSAETLLDVQLRVSSKHLMLASPTFSNMLSSNFAEGQLLRSEGSTDIALGDDDPDAFIILLNIIHGFSRKVPREISLDMLTKVSILVNYYHMHEVVELWSDTWINNLASEGLPDSLSPDAIRWLMISWVFQKPLEFKAMSRIIERDCDETLEEELEEGLPIPASVIETIKSHRIAAITAVISSIHAMIQTYTTPALLCTHETESSNQLACDALLLGSLIKGCSALLIYPFPIPPYRGLTLKLLSEQIHEMKILDICNHTRGRYYLASDGHGVKDSIEAELKVIEDGLSGLELKDFLAEKKPPLP